MERFWNVYLSGEIHTDWREEIKSGVEALKIPVRLAGPETDHQTSDECGEKILGPEADRFWSDHKAAKINAVRNRGVLKNSDIVVVRFGDKYRQWNAAFDAGQAVVMDKSLITLHDESLDHALKEVDSAALAVTRNCEQVIKILEYITRHPF